MKFAILLAVVLFPALISPADTIRLTTGKNLTGHVTSYANMAFEVQEEKGQLTKLPAPSVASIDFDKGAIEAMLETRTGGKVQRKISLYDKGAFSVEDDKGTVQKMPAMMVTSASFGGGGSAESGSSSSEVKIIGHGQKIDLAKHLVRGQVTIVDFYADWCGPCRLLGPQLEKIAKEDPEVVLRKMDIVRWGTPVTQQFAINAIPRVQIYGKAGKLVGEFTGGREKELKELIQKGKTQ